MSKVVAFDAWGQGFDMSTTQTGGGLTFLDPNITPIYLGVIDDDTIAYSVNGADPVRYMIVSGVIASSGDANITELYYANKNYDPIFWWSNINLRVSLNSNFSSGIFYSILNGADEIFGNSYRDFIKAGTGDDQIFSSLGDDTVYGESGNDKIDGGNGYDVAGYLGRRSDYVISRIANEITVQDAIRSRDGTDTLVQIEKIQFSDSVVTFDTAGNAGMAFRLYKAALDRTPDERGLAGWIKYMNEGGSLNAMAQQFIDSQEFRSNYGPLDDRNFVNRLYLNVLDRNGEEAGVSGWVGGLAGGLSRAQVLAGFSESSENQANVMGLIQNGISYSEWWLN